MLTFLIVHQSLAELFVPFVKLDEIPKQDQLTVLSLFSLSRNREESINGIAVGDCFIGIMKVLADIPLHNKFKESDSIVIMSNAIHSVYLHKFPDKIMVVHKPILVLD